MNRFFTILLMVSNFLYVIDNSHCGNTLSGVTFSTPAHIGLRDSILGGNFDAIVVNRDCSGNVIDRPTTAVRQIFTELQKCINPEKWTFVVFSETFFGNNGVMDKAEADAIVTECNDFSAKHRNILIHINFLHKFANNDRPLWLPQTGIQEGVIASDRITCLVPEASKATVFAQREQNLRISNYSILIWFGRPISFYRKSTYCNEANTLIAKNESGHFHAGEYMYEFGDFQDHVLAGLDDEHRYLANMLFPDTGNFLINTRICYDLNEMENLRDSVKLLIVNANQAPIISGWKRKIPNDELMCIHADMYRQNPDREAYQTRGEIGYPNWTYSFLKKNGRFLPIRHRHSLIDLLPFYVYVGVRNGFVENPEDKD